MVEYVVGYTDDLDTMHVRERVVRCRDCKEAKTFDSRHSWFACGRFLDPCDDNPVMVEPDGFCAWGEPRVVTADADR